MVLYPDTHKEVAIILLRRSEYQKVAHYLGHHWPDIWLFPPQDIGELSSYAGQDLFDDLLLLTPIRENALAAEVAAQLSAHLLETQVDLSQNLWHISHRVLALRGEGDISGSDVNEKHRRSHRYAAACGLAQGIVLPGDALHG